MIKNIIYYILLICLVSSCKQKAAEPSYLKIDYFLVTTNVITQGTAVQTINEVTLYIDDQNAGVYHLPALVPLATSGNHKILIAPMVVENAIASNPRYSYLFLTSFDTTINFTGSNTMEVRPRTTYKPSVKFEMIEDFENPVPLIRKSPNNTVDTLLRDSLPEDNILNTGHCGLFEIPNGKYMEYISKNAYSLPSSTSSDTYIEINYKTELPLDIGLYISGQAGTGLVRLNPKSTWSKAYINITNEVSVKPIGTVFELAIAAGNADGITKKVYIDNIKIIHFE